MKNKRIDGNPRGSVRRAAVEHALSVPRRGEASIEGRCGGTAPGPRHAGTHRPGLDLEGGKAKHTGNGPKGTSVS